MSQPPFRSSYRSSLVLVYHLSASDHRCRQRLSTRPQLHRRTPIGYATLDLFLPNETLQCTTRRRPCHRKRHLTSVQSRTGACRSPCTRDRRRSPLLPPILAGAREPRCCLRIVVLALSLVGASRPPSDSLPPREDRQVVVRRRSSRSAVRAGRGAWVISISAAEESVIHTGNDIGSPC